MKTDWSISGINMEEKDFYDYQYTDWDLDTIDLHFVSGRELMNLSLCDKLNFF